MIKKQYCWKAALHLKKNFRLYEWKTEYNQLSPLNEAMSAWNYKNINFFSFVLFFFTCEVSERITTIC